MGFTVWVIPSSSTQAQTQQVLSALSYTRHPVILDVTAAIKAPLNDSVVG